VPWRRRRRVPERVQSCRHRYVWKDRFFHHERTREEVDDLHISLKDLSNAHPVNEWWRVSVDGEKLDTVNDIHDTAERLSADGDENGRARVDDLLTAKKTLGTSFVHSDGTEIAFTK
jgi:hypothetical protein